MPDLSFLSVFLLGLLGGFHCAGMCGGIVVLLNRPIIPITKSHGPAISDHDPIDDVSFKRGKRSRFAVVAVVLARQIAYSLGRVGSYTIAGGLMGALGSSTLLLKHILPIEQIGFGYLTQSCCLGSRCSGFWSIAEKTLVAAGGSAHPVCLRACWLDAP
ncbi:MAG: sulfite exporter TauE/SafE family protein [Betaproteobacteria bacterium]|nr:sulfite exporter TauE/SafE family protein [Betaproteobacteria bacterium]